MEAYLAAKLRLFTDLSRRAAGGDQCRRQHCRPGARRGRSARAEGADGRRGGEGIRLVDGAIDGFGQRVKLTHAGREYHVKLPLVGAFQVAERAGGAGLAIATGSEPDAVFAALEKLQGAKGRLELVGQRNGAPVFVDYAHKPDALRRRSRRCGLIARAG